MIRQLTFAALAILLAIGILWSGRWDLQAAQADQDHYCKMISEGHWPAYKGWRGCPDRLAGR